MEFKNNIPAWKNGGREPPEEIRSTGFAPGYKPPAAYFNWFWHLMTAGMDELQKALAAYAAINDADKADLLRAIAHHMPIYVQGEEPQADGPFLWYDIGDTPPEPAPEAVLLQLGDSSIGGEVYALIDDAQYTVENAEKANDPAAGEPLEIKIN